MKRRVGDHSVSDVFVASHLFCVISERESALRGKLNSDLEMSIQVLYMPGYERGPDPALVFAEWWINVTLTGEH